ECFPPETIEVESRGNVFTATAFLQGLSLEDIASFEHHADDSHFPLTILARAVKAGSPVADRALEPAAENARAAAASRFLNCLRNPDVAPIVIVVAHPDDEVVGAGAHLSFWPGVTVVHVTSGAPRDERWAREAGFTNRSAYAAARRREAEAALAIAGIPPDRLIGLEFDDQDASLRMAEVARRLAALLVAARPAMVMTHPYE